MRLRPVCFPSERASRRVLAEGTMERAIGDGYTQAHPAVYLPCFAPRTCCLYRRANPTRSCVEPEGTSDDG